MVRKSLIYLCCGAWLEGGKVTTPGNSFVLFGWSFLCSQVFGQASMESCEVEFVRKLEGVGPFDNRPSTVKLHHFVQKEKKRRKKMWQVTLHTWHVTRDTWRVTHDTWHVTCLNILSNFQLPSFYCLWFMVLWRSGGKGWLNQLITELMMRLFIEQPHRTAPATLGLLIRRGGLNSSLLG